MFLVGWGSYVTSQGEHIFNSLTGNGVVLQLSVLTCTATVLTCSNFPGTPVYDNSGWSKSREPELNGVDLVNIHKIKGWCVFLIRLALAALHFNENSNREQAVTQQGEEYYDILFPKYKKGGYIVRYIQTTLMTFKQPCNSAWMEALKLQPPIFLGL